jgi:hypothetical protein
VRCVAPAFLAGVFLWPSPRLQEAAGGKRVRQQDVVWQLKLRSRRRWSATPQEADCATMTKDSVADAKHWHDRATEMRKLAETMKDAYAKGEMLKIATSYARLALWSAERESRA